MDGGLAGHVPHSASARARVRVLVPLLVLVVLMGAVALPAPVAAANSLGLRATYDVSATLSFADRTLAVRSSASVTNGTAEAVDALAFNLLPSKIGGYSLHEVLVADQPATATKSGQTLTVNLSAPLEPEASVSVVIAYSARFNTNAIDKNWMFAKLNGVVTAYRWIPWLSRAVKFNRPNFGDPFVTGTSPEVRVAITTDRALVFATTGRRVAQEGLTQTFVAERVRDFNFSASHKYKFAKGKVNGIKVHVYHVSLPASTMVNWAKRSLAHFSQRVGRYPYERFVVAQTEGGTGMESPGLIWIPRSTRKSNLGYLIAHETAHQWFYAVVGSDQAAEPWADEAPADFMARDLLVNRRKSKCAKTTLDRTLYDYSRECYYEAIYIQGGNYLHSYRQRVGAEAFWSGLRAYYDEYSFRLGGTRQLLDTLDGAAGAVQAGQHGERFPRFFRVE
ncbi:MAG TPA: hypothetical protein VMP67_01680 [Candidatus Limnocylindria bacterium]|nr:hypothetical protein [Candidatus Limnocylindria bacterium]